MAGGFSVKEWADRYDDPLEHLYEEAIGKDLTEERVWNLFVWKLSMPARPKKTIQDKFVAKIGERPDPDVPDSVLAFLKQPGGPIWRIFWLHCLYPNRFPIYDQHAHRGLADIERWREKEVPSSDLRKVRFYLERYRPAFIKMAERKKVKPRELDKALWAYGKNLKTKRA